MATNDSDATVTLGEGVVTIKRKGSSALTIANILGTVEKPKEKAIYLDRLVHRPHEQSLGSFHVSGATTTILIQAET